MNTNQFSAPGFYRIVLQGHLNQNWVERLGSMQIQQPDQRDSPLTVLEGEVRDQAELSGILNTLYDLHLSLLSVNYLNKPDSPPEN